MNAEKTGKRPIHTGSSKGRQYSIGRAGTSINMVKIDHPREGEIITSQDYTIRISTAIPADKVEVSIDGGNWISCRESMGYWWFDWKKYKSKKYALDTRLFATKGSRYDSSLRRFIVKLK